jgi:hypothetical protein
MNYKESYLKRQSRLVPYWANSRNKKFPITNFNKLPKGYKSKNFVIKDERELIKLCYAYGLLENEVKVTISDEVKEIVAEQVSSRAEFEKEIKKLEIRAKYKKELEKMEDKKFKQLSLGQQLVIKLAYKIDLIEFT